MIARHVRSAVADYWPVLLLFAAWQSWIAGAHVPRIVAPSPAAVAGELLAHPAVYLDAAAITLVVAAAGLIAGMLLGVGLALATWCSRFVTGALTLPALLVQSTPLVALMPVLARLLGYDLRTVVASAALITFFPSFVLIAAGLRRLPPGTADVFAVLGATRFRRLRLLAAPAAIPQAFVALRIASANCILAALVAQYLMGTSGLGRLFASSQSRFDTAGAWAACLVATALSVAAYLGCRRLEAAVARRFAV